jgi:hypothetical protein
MPAKPGQPHLALAISAVLRLVDDDEGIVQCPPERMGDRCDLDRSLGERLLDPPGAEAFVQCIVEGTQVGCELVADVA